MTRNRSVELSTIIGKGSKITGNLNVDGGVRIDGEIEGELVSNGFVTIGQTGIAKASISAVECLIAGRVEGNIAVKEGLELDKTAILTGDITAKVVKITAGAVFNGTSKMNSTTPGKQTVYYPKNAEKTTDNKK